MTYALSESTRLFFIYVTQKINQFKVALQLVWYFLLHLCFLKDMFPLSDIYRVKIESLCEMRKLISESNQSGECSSFFSHS